MRRRSHAGLCASERGSRVVGAAIFALAVLVRLMPLGLYVTPDEPIWVLRSHQFLEAIETGDWAAAPQTGHPGMTTMALGALGIWLTERLSPAATAIHRDWIGRIASLAPENGAAFRHLVAFLPAGRVVVASVTAGGLALAYLIGRRRFGDRAARVAALFMALDPFLAGHSGLLHTDGLQATFVLLAVLLSVPRRDQFVDASGDRRGRYEALSIVAAAFFLALAGLTKMLGLLAAPGLALATFLWWSGPAWKRGLRVAALALLTLTFLAVLYPPAWVDPRSALESLIGAVTYHESIGLRPVFFAGKTSTDPGPWFYPAVLLFRSTPPVLLGLIGLGWRRRDPHTCGLCRLIWISLPVLSYMVGISVASKKFDRYVLSTIPLLTLVAVQPWLHPGRRWRLGTLIGLTLPWALVSILPLQYANPMLGGPWVAQDIVPLGWGEASGLAARWLSSQPWAAESATVMTANVPGAAGLFAGEIRPWSETTVGCTDFVIGQESDLPATHVLLADLRAAGREQVRIYGHIPMDMALEPAVAPGSLPGVAVDAVAPSTDSDALRFWLAQRFAAGDSFIWLHAPQCYPLTEAQLSHVIDEGIARGALVCEPYNPTLGVETERCSVLSVLPEVAAFRARFGGALDLVAATWDAEVHAPDPLTIRFRWRAQVPLEEVGVYLGLRNAASTDEVIWTEGGRRLLSDWGWAAPSWPTGGIVDAEAYVPLPLHLPPGTYSLVLRVSGPTGAMGMTTPDGVFGGTELFLGVVQVTQASSVAGDIPLSPQIDGAWPGLKVVGAEIATGSLQAGQRMPFSLGLERVVGTPPDALHWDLVCGGVRRDGGELPLSPYHLESWPQGYRYILRFTPRVDPGTPEGACVASVWPSGVQDTSSTGGERSVLGTVTITQRPRSYRVPDPMDVVSTVTAEQLADLLGADISAMELAAEELLTVTLYWRARGDVARDYTVFVHAIGPDGEVWAQSDAWPAQGAAPTTTWVAGEIIVDEHRLTLPDGAPRGAYTLGVGLYDAGDGSRVVLTMNGEQVADDRAPVATLEVVNRP